MTDKKPIMRVSSLKLPRREVLTKGALLDGADARFGRTIVLYWSEEQERPLWIDFEVFEAVGRESPGALISTRADHDGAPLYYATEEREMTLADGAGLTPDLERAVFTVNGFVKWDGCTQVYFPESGPSVHYDDLASLRGLFDTICQAQERCYEIMEVG